MPLELSIGTDLNAVDSWDKLAQTGGLAPWESLSVRLTRTPTHGKEKARVLFKCTDMYYGNARCIVHSLPDDPGLVLNVSPWLSPPIYSNSVVLSRLMKDGVEVEMPYGWYVFGCAPFKCGKFSCGVAMPDVSSWPCAFTRPAANPVGLQ